MSEGFAKKVANTQVWKAIFRHGPPNNARNRLLLWPETYFFTFTQ